MSLILDALKKSEQERQREKAPGLQSIHQPNIRVAKNTHRGQWLFFAALLMINAGVLIYWYLHKTPSIETATRSEPAPAAAASAPIERRESVSAPAPKTSTTSPSAEYAQISPHATPAISAPSDTSAPIEEVGELPDEVRNNLPAMTFSFHVYSPNSQQRTIIINNRRMREGEEISAGVQLQEITEDGVILNYDKHRIHIGVLSGW